MIDAILRRMGYVHHDVISNIQKHNRDIRDRELELVRSRFNIAVAALTTITHMETPGANATVKRMAGVARDTLDELRWG